MSDTLTAGSQVGRYVVKRKLAEGGMAELYLCTATGPEGFAKEVVIKRVRSFLASDDGFMKMFVDEARLASRLNHANVVQIFDFAKHDDTYFIAMEFVHGVSLWDLRRRCRELSISFPPTLVAEIGAAVARGLHYAHSLTDKGKPLGIVHRDVTPHNVLLSFDGAIKLTDFGIAKAGTSSNYTAPGMLKGKFAYMSPEQSRGDRVDSRTDVFALGIVLWEMLTGGRLFEGDSDVAVLRAVQESFIAPPARLNPEVPPELDQVVLKALARQLGERFQTAQELERALANFVLRHATSVEDTSVASFLGALFKDELEAARQAEAARGDGTQSTAKTPPGEGLGPTAVVKRDHATPSKVPERPRTAVQPGVGRPRGALVDDDRADVSTDQSGELNPSPNPTAVLPRGPDSQKVKVRDSLLKEMTDASEEVKAQLQAERAQADQTRQRPTESFSAPTPAAIEPIAPRRSLTPWVLTACAALGAIGAVGVLVFNARLPAQNETEVAGRAAEEPPVAAPPSAAVAEPLVAAPPGEGPLVAAPPSPIAVGEPPVAAAAELAPEREADPEPTPEARPQPPEPVKAPAAKPATKATRAGEVAAVGFLKVDARPFAEVTIDGHKQPGEVQGERTFPLHSGVHQVVLKHPRKTEPFQVTVEPGKTVEHSFRPVAGP